MSILKIVAAFAQNLQHLNKRGYSSYSKHFLGPALMKWIGCSPIAGIGDIFETKAWRREMEVILSTGFMPTNKCRSQKPIRRGEWFINTSPSQPDGFKLCKTTTNHTQALGRACSVTPFWAWHHYYPYSTQCIWSTLRDAILVLPTPCIPCPKQRDDGFDLSNSHSLMQKRWEVDYDRCPRIRLRCSMGNSALLRN